MIFKSTEVLLAYQFSRKKKIACYKKVSIVKIRYTT